MIFVNHVERAGVTRESYTTFLRLLAAFAPHITEELWATAGKQGSVHEEAWPIAEEQFLVEESCTVSVQINGKMRGTVVAKANATEEAVLTLVRNDPHLGQRVVGEIKKIVYVPGRIMNVILTETTNT